MGQPRPLFRLFAVFSNRQYNFCNKSMWKMSKCPSTIRRWDSNPWPGLPPAHQLVLYLHSHPNGYYWGHQCSWTLTPANSMQVWQLQQEVTRLKAWFKPTSPKKSGVDGGSNQVPGQNFSFSEVLQLKMFYRFLDALQHPFLESLIREAVKSKIAVKL